MQKNSKLNLNQKGGHARQGDTMLRRIDSIPAGVKQLKRQSVTLALGEKTGHHHTIDSGAVGYANNPESAIADFVEVKPEAAPLTHQEHDAISYPAGQYERLVQVEDTGSEIAPVRD